MGSSPDDQDNRGDPYQVVDVQLSMVDVIQGIRVHVRLALVHEIVVTDSEGVDSTWVSLVPVHHQGHLDAVQSFDHPEKIYLFSPPSSVGYQHVTPLYINL